ncbi:uncharacterized protein EI97DRAFT_457003 [Westerdykella ornata]|uniref:Uncharacterized protein n=1 Tax=Westerdykella ornata TaxID=318751 RepID=A0A6A6JND2_WESOR|nr:uncharacterized protein EI97DRAFT_457003 [Westerdykella ornata]KAF2277754.1 hypothetical protein EI97DRAFT_457003 [Westerdykella ornata]
MLMFAFPCSVDNLDKHEKHFPIPDYMLGTWIDYESPSTKDIPRISFTYLQEGATRQLRLQGFKIPAAYFTRILQEYKPQSLVIHCVEVEPEFEIYVESLLQLSTLENLTFSAVVVQYRPTRRGVRTSIDPDPDVLPSIELRGNQRIKDYLSYILERRNVGIYARLKYHRRMITILDFPDPLVVMPDS